MPGRRESFLRAVASGALALAFLFAAPWSIPESAPGTARGSAQAAELVMFETLGCRWCLAWDKEVGVIYHKTAEGRTAPLRRLDIGDLRPPELYQRSLVMTHRDGFPHASRLGFSARSAWRGDAGHREPRAPSTSIGPPESPGLKALGKPPPRSRGRTAGGRREALTMPRIACGSPPARRIARAISMGHY